MRCVRRLRGVRASETEIYKHDNRFESICLKFDAKWDVQLGRM